MQYQKNIGKMCASKIDQPLPADEGHQAFRDRKTPEDNPYAEDDWRNKEWLFGWECEEQSNDGMFDWAAGKFN